MDTDEVEPRGWRPWLLKGAFESALIVFSVLLALTVDNCRERAIRLRDLTEARISLVQELESNRDLLKQKSYFPYHQHLMEIYRALDSSGETAGGNALFETGVHVASLHDSAWRSFVSSPIAMDMPFRSRAFLAEVYAQQEQLAGLHQSMLASLMVPTADRQRPLFMRDQIGVIRLYLGDVTAAEQRLLAGYDEAISHIR